MISWHLLSFRPTEDIIYQSECTCVELVCNFIRILFASCSNKIRTIPCNLGKRTCKSREFFFYMTIILAGCTMPNTFISLTVLMILYYAFHQWTFIWDLGIHSIARDNIQRCPGILTFTHIIGSVQRCYMESYQATSHSFLITQCNFPRKVFFF